MSKLKKIGIILILFGIGLPLISLVFASNYNPRVGLIDNIQTMEIVIRESKEIDIRQLKKAGFTEQEIQSYLKKEGFTDKEIREAKIGDMFVEKLNESVLERLKRLRRERIRKEKIAIPYRYVFATSIILVFTGIGITVLSNNRKVE